MSRQVRGPRLRALAFTLVCIVACSGAHAAGDLAAAREAAQRRDYDAALVDYEALLEHSPRNVDLLIETARVNGFADRNRAAAALYRRALEAEPSRRADILPSLAWQTLWSGDAADAATLFAEVAQGGDRADALDGLGQAREAQGDNAGALLAFREAAARQPDALPLQRRLARSLLWNDRFGEAIDRYRTLCASHPQDRACAWGLGNALNFAGAHREAIAVFESAGAPRSPGERLDLARAYSWAGFPDLALPLLVGLTDADAAWLRDWRLVRELSPYVYGAFDASVDRDDLKTWSLTIGGGTRPEPGANLEVRARQLALRSPDGSQQGPDLQLLYRWRVGMPTSDAGTVWPTFALRVTNYGDWTPATGFARAKWIPRDAIRVDAEAGRELVETPQAIANRVTVDTLSLGADWRATPRWTTAAALALLRFDDGNLRTRLQARFDHALSLWPRWTVGGDAMAFEDTDPTGPNVPGRGYWNPRRYGELRAFTALSIEQGPWDFSARIALGASRETDGWGNVSRGHPDLLELAVAYDLSSTMRLRLAAGGSGSGVGLAGGGPGYWRRAASVSLVGWY